MNNFRYSLLDTDLPLLAIDAASEIDSHITSGYKLNLDLTNTKQLLHRLEVITSSNAEIDVDKQIYIHVLAPLHDVGADLLCEPISVKSSIDKLSQLLVNQRLESDDEQAFLKKLRDIFIGLSEFSVEARRNLMTSDSDPQFATF